MKQIDIREGARRQHRATAVFAVVQCWVRGLDGVVLKRITLERLLGLERFKATRVKWLLEDFKEYFPFQMVVKRSKRKNAAGELNSLSSLWVSRSEFAKSFPAGAMTVERRLAVLSSGKCRFGLFALWPSTKKSAQSDIEAFLPFFSQPANFDERFLTSYLTLLCQGQIAPSDLPSLVTPEE